MTSQSLTPASETDVVIEELRLVMADEARSGERLNNLADEFRTGRDTLQLLAALDSDETEIVSLAVWILAELPLGRYDGDELLGRVRRLTGHRDPAVRFIAVMALFPALDPGDPFTHDLLERLARDPNEDARKMGRYARKRLLGPE